MSLLSTCCVMAQSCTSQHYASSYVQVCCSARPSDTGTPAFLSVSVATVAALQHMQRCYTADATRFSHPP
mgnify:CR=1 FL=1